MRDNEYSLPNREFSTIGQEISTFGHEWNAPPREGNGMPGEVVCFGGEYHQGSTFTGRRRAKRHRFRFSMLAAAAAVVAVIAFAPAEPMQYPVQELSAEQRAYLDAVWSAVETSDLDKLEELVQEEMARDIVINVVAPYAHRMAEEYERLGESSTFIQEGTPAIHMEDIVFQEGGRYTISYDGEVLCVTTYQPEHLVLGYESAVTESSAQEVYVQCTLWDVSSIRSGGHFYNAKSVFIDLTHDDGGSSSKRLTWRDCSYYDGEPAGEWNLIYRYMYDVDRKEEISIRGEFRPEEVDLSDTGEPRTVYYCLHNGTVTLVYSDESGSTGGTLDVVDGYTVRWSDTVSIEEQERIRLYKEDGTLTPHYLIKYTWDGLRDVERLLQHNPLYHQFRAGFVGSD